MADEKVIKIVTEADAKAYDFGTKGPAQEREVEDFHEKFTKSIDKFFKTIEKQEKYVDDLIEEDKRQVLDRQIGTPRGKIRTIISGKRQGRPPSEDKEENEGPSSWAVTMVKRMQKVVTAFEGTNGRATKGLAVLRRSLEAMDKAYGHHDKAVTASTQRTVDVAEIQSGEVARVTKTIGQAAKTTSTAWVGAAKVLGGFAAATAAAAFAASLLSRGIESLQEVVGKFSGALNTAQAGTKIAEIQERMRSAGKVGGDLSSLEETNRGIKLELIRLKTEVIDFLTPILDVLGGTLTAILKVCNVILEVLNFLSEIIEKFVEGVLGILEHVPIIGGAAKVAKEWMMKEDINNAKGVKELNKVVDNIFDVDPTTNIFGDKMSKEDQKKFLPVKGF